MSKPIRKIVRMLPSIDASYGARIGDGWDVNARLRRSTQDTFMRRYKFDGDTKLTVKGRRGASEAEPLLSGRGILTFRVLNSADTPEKEPTVLPHVFYEKVRPGLRPGQRIKTEISAIQVDNDDQHDLSRWVGNVEMHDEIKTLACCHRPAGGRDRKLLQHPEEACQRDNKTDDLGRVTPQLSAGWRMPLALTSVESISRSRNRRCSLPMLAGQT